MNKTNQKKLDDFKKRLKLILGKDSDFIRFDFERYIFKMYGAQFHNSLQELYQSQGEDIIINDDKEYVDCLAFQIVSNRYRVAEIKGKYFNGNNKGQTTLLYSYDGNYITDMFCHVAGLKDADMWGLVFIHQKHTQKN